MKAKKAFILGVVFGVLLATLCFIGYKKFEKELGKELGEGIAKEVAQTSQVDDLCVIFQIKYSRWPKSKAELQKFMKDNKEYGDFDLTPYKNLTFKETAKKKLKIHYDSYKKGDTSTGPSDEEIDFGSPNRK